MSSHPPELRAFLDRLAEAVAARVLVELGAGEEQRAGTARGGPALEDENGETQECYFPCP